MEEYTKLIYKLAWSFHRSTGIEFEELVSQATLLAVEAKHNYDPSRSAFSTFMYTAVRNGLITFVKSEKQGNVSIEDIAESFDSGTPTSSIDFMIELEGLPKRTRLFAKEILRHRNKFLKKTTISNVVTHFRSIGWKYQDIWNSIKEIKAFI